jgi:DNA-binding IclR family transcriptional regulator
VILLDTNKNNIKSVVSGYLILKAFEKRREPLTLSEISQLTNMHKSRLYRYLNTMVDLGLLTRYDYQNFPTWTLGPELITLGEAAFDSFDLAKESIEELIKLKNKLNETVALSIWREEGPFFIRWEKSNSTINLGLETGLYIPIYSASGKVFRAFMPQEITNDLYENEVQKGKIDPESYREEIELVKKRKVAFSEASYIQGVVAISAPIFYSNQELAGAMSVIGINGILDTSMEGKAVQSLIETTERISRKLSSK